MIDTLHAVAKSFDTNTIHQVATGAKYIIDTLTVVIIGIFTIVTYIAGHAHGIKTVVRQSIKEGQK